MMAWTRHEPTDAEVTQSRASRHEETTRSMPKRRTDTLMLSPRRGPHQHQQTTRERSRVGAPFPACAALVDAGEELSRRQGCCWTEEGDDGGARPAAVCLLW